MEWLCIEALQKLVDEACSIQARAFENVPVVAEPKPAPERYSVVFGFGSFCYMFFIIGFVAGLVAGILAGAWTLLAGQPGEQAALYLTALPMGVGAVSASIGLIGFYPYQLLCRRGLGWPIMGLFAKLEP